MYSKISTAKQVLYFEKKKKNKNKIEKIDQPTGPPNRTQTVSRCISTYKLIGETTCNGCCHRRAQAVVNVCHFIQNGNLSATSRGAHIRVPPFMSLLTSVCRYSIVGNIWIGAFVQYTYRIQGGSRRIAKSNIAMEMNGDSRIIWMNFFFQQNRLVRACKHAFMYCNICIRSSVIFRGLF